MKHTFWLLLAALVLSGCAQMRQREIARDDAYCRSLGADHGSPQYVQCRLVQDRKRDADNAAIARAGAAIYDAGTPRAPQPGESKTMHCTPSGRSMICR
jgi:hypothetical protein